jgi:hypothetical protein
VNTVSTFRAHYLSLHYGLINTGTGNLQQKLHSKFYNHPRLYINIWYSHSHAQTTVLIEMMILQSQSAEKLRENPVANRHLTANNAPQ